MKLQGAGGGGASSSSDSGDKKGCFAGTETLLLNQVHPFLWKMSN